MGLPASLFSFSATFSTTHLVHVGRSYLGAGDTLSLITGSFCIYQTMLREDLIRRTGGSGATETTGCAA